MSTELLIVMFERLGIIVMVAFVMTRIPFIRKMIDQHAVTRKQQIGAMLLFGFFGIIGTYTGVVITTGEAGYTMWFSPLAEDEAIVNARVIGIVAAGLLGGWKIGLGAGIIAGGHRALLGGFTGIACGLSAVLSGVLAGLASRYMKRGSNLSLPVTLAVGMTAEAMQMALILGISRPFEQAQALVGMIGMPMILANGVGAMVFVLIIRNVIKEEEKQSAMQSGRALRIAEETTRYMRHGLTPESAADTCRILLREAGASAVSMTNGTHVLSYRGDGEDRCRPGLPIQTEATKQVIQNGNLYTGVLEEDDAGFTDHPRMAVIAPLKQRDRVVGTLKFYYRNPRDASPVELELIRGLAKLLSGQLEAARAEALEKLAHETEVKALQAQVSPHFLFNALNIIVSMIRTNPERARKLLLSLSAFFRQNLAGVHREQITLEEELRHVRSYLDIQSARFDEALEIDLAVDPALLGQRVPIFSLQPLVENAFHHGRTAGETPFYIHIGAALENGLVQLTVRDNGRGITEERQAELLQKPVHSENGTGIGLYNLQQRVQDLFPKTGALAITSGPDMGTEVRITLSEWEGESDHETDTRSIG
ncbi:LytS/YhcK type 5TM receptor domain-containing protein [Alkalicoccus urumqiensis]|uniref:histidine kinase n=1 Tax=Alkalicoccus urumqiensis TaxID=1548213 RepID=A0A2P6MLE4_ALKUR|nr:LytS/YhcK type 5TM receptor domain-containing protein [Alkalicoccus urumqiensis]PRO67098.1 sensor histidine kinase [Alkalicoccus urumqiensis]